MEHRGQPGSLAERILAAAGRAVVVRGPAGSGKTSAAMEVYRRHLDEAGRPTCLLLAPNAPAAYFARRGLIESSGGGVLISPAVITFDALAGRILAAAGERARMMSAFRRHLLLGRIVADLAARGELAALGAVADTPGLVGTLDRAIAELKRAAVEPEDLAKAVGRRRDKRGDLVAIYRLYQQHLHEGECYDVEGQMWLAREHLRMAAAGGGELPGVAGFRVVVADGFTDFTSTQLEILALLAERLDRVIITLPHAEDGRERMWHWTSRTLGRIRERFGAGLVEIEAVPAARRAEALRPLWDGLFDIDARFDLPAGLTIIAAAGVDAEVAAVARRVKALLAGGARAGTIAVLARSLEGCREAIERTFAAHDIPVAPAPRALTEVPVVRFALAAAALAPQFAWRDCLRTIRNSYFRPASLGEYDAGTVAAAEMLIREGNVLEGRQAYADAAARVAARLRRQAETADEDDDEAAAPNPHRPTPESILQAGEMLGRLFDLAEGATDPAGLSALIDALDLRAAACGHDRPELVARDLRALAALGEHLAEVPAPAPDLAGLREALGQVRCPPARSEALVDVLDVLDGRAMRYEHVFLLGVSERSFPPRFVEGSLIGEADRAEWRRHGVSLDSRRDLTAREMLLFYLAVSRASKGLTLSYLEADASGKTGSPSGFLLSLVHGGGGLEAARPVRIAPGSLVPPADELAAPADAFNAALVGLFGDEAEGSEAALAWVLRNRPGTLLRACMGIYARHRRWLPGECDEFDGRITDPALLKVLRQRYPAETVFSAQRLNTYGQCPWQYFATYVLKLAPPLEPQRRLEPRARGTFCHDVLFRLMRSLAERAGGSVRLEVIDEADLSGALDEAVAAEADAVEAARPPYPVLWDIQRRQMRQEMWEYLLAARSRRASLLPTGLHFELAFGQEPREGELRDSASRDGPVSLTAGGRDILLRGRIDRVDRVRLDDLKGLLVVDYKTGRLPSDADILSGRNLQLPLYAAAAEKLLGRPCLGGVFHKIGSGAGNFERYFAAVTTSRSRDAAYKPDESYEDNREAVLETIGRFVEGMGAGRFDALPTHKCPSYCPFRRICQYSQSRVKVKVAAGGGAEGKP